MGWLPNMFFWASKFVHHWLGIASLLGITMSFFRVFGKKEEKEEKKVEVKKLRPSLDTKLAIEFVQKNSNPEQKERLECILTGRKVKEEILNSLIELQNPDGGFPYGLERGRPSSIMDSLLALVRLEEYNSLDHESVDRVIRFLFSVQNNDGSWEESDAIEQFSPPSWMKPGDLKAKVLTTAYTSFWLAKLNYVDREELIDAMDFLMRFVHPDGHFYGFLHTNWVAASFLAMMLGRDHWAVRGAISFLREIPAESWEPSQIGWLLWSLASAGFTAEDPEVKYFLDILDKKQWEDGSFEPEAEGREVETTIAIIKALKLLGLIQKS